MEPEPIDREVRSLEAIDDGARRIEDASESNAPAHTTPYCFCSRALRHTVVDRATGKE